MWVTSLTVGGSGSGCATQQNAGEPSVNEGHLQLVGKCVHSIAADRTDGNDGEVHHLEDQTCDGCHQEHAQSPDQSDLQQANTGLTAELEGLRAEVANATCAKLQASCM